MSLIVFCSGKGSPGTTFSAIHVANAIGRDGTYTLLVDLDPSGGDVAAYLGLDTRRGVFPLFRMSDSTPDVTSLLAESQERARIRVVAGLPEASAVSLSLDLLTHTLVDAASERTVVCDVGRATSGGAHLAARADAVVVVVRPDVVSVLGAERALRLLESNGVARERTSLLIAGFERRRPADRVEVAKALERPVLGALPIHRASARFVLRTQVPVEKGPLARAYQTIATGLLASMADVPAKEVAVA